MSLKLTFDTAEINPKSVKFAYCLFEKSVLRYNHKGKTLLTFTDIISRFLPKVNRRVHEMTEKDKICIVL